MSRRIARREIAILLTIGFAIAIGFAVEGLFAWGVIR